MRWFAPLLLLLLGADAPLPTRGTVERVYDGDTLTLAGGDKVRLKWANTPELRPMEPYGIEARDEARRFLGYQEVTLGVNPATARDGYGRLLATVHARDGDLSVHLLERGLAHVFIIPPVDGDPAPYLAAQARAKAERLGIWSTDRYRGALHVTSFHANGSGDERLDPNLEYVRVCNVSDGPVDLAGYVVTNRIGSRFPLPSVVVPAGYTVQLRSGRGEHQADPERQIEVFLGSDAPIWDDEHDRLTLLDLAGNVVDAVEHRVGSK